jgi:hypothetical protein
MTRRVAVITFLLLVVVVSVGGGCGNPDDQGGSGHIGHLDE